VANIARSEIATATDCDWSFTSNADLMAALESQARRTTGLGVDSDDALQEVVLWLAVRPELHSLDIPLILNHTRSRIQELNRRAKEIFDIELDYGSRREA